MWVCAHSPKFAFLLHLVWITFPLAEVPDRGNFPQNFPNHINIQLETILLVKLNVMRVRSQTAEQGQHWAHIHSFIAVKPDGVQLGEGACVSKCFEEKGFRLVGLNLMQASEGLLKEHYFDLEDHPFFTSLWNTCIQGQWLPRCKDMLRQTNHIDSKPRTFMEAFASNLVVIL